MLQLLDLVGFTTMVVAIRARIAGSLTRSYPRRRLLSFRSLGRVAVLLLLPILRKGEREVRRAEREGVHRTLAPKKETRKREKQRDRSRRLYAWISLP
jgi:hypothetical protein